MRIYYENHIGETINLLKKPYKCTETDVFDSSWEEESDGYTKELELDVMDDPVNFVSNMNNLYKIIAKDGDNKRYGKLWVNGTYLICKCVLSEKEGWKGGVYSYVYLTFKAPELSWIMEDKQEFFAQTLPSGYENVGIDYPHDYSHDYGYSLTGLQTWNVDHTAPSDFAMIIYGPCTNPSIYINGHIYQVNVTIPENSYVIIDSMTSTIFIYRPNSDGENIFDLRNKESSVFQKIDPGAVVVDYSGKFGFTVILYKKRKEPVWESIKDSGDAMRNYEELRDRLGDVILDRLGNALMARRLM